jgi:hypothetical protein
MFSGVACLFLICSWCVGEIVGVVFGVLTLRSRSRRVAGPRNAIERFGIPHLYFEPGGPPRLALSVRGRPLGYEVKNPGFRTPSQHTGIT